LGAVPPNRKASRRPTVVCLVRHGTTPTTGKVLPGRAKGLHLSDKGLEEADRVGERLSTLGSVRALYASPLERTRETAKRISAHLGLPVVAERGLLECDFGEWTGAALADLRRRPEWVTVQQHPSGFRFPGGESFAELRARMASCVERLVAAHEGEVIVAVSHADPIKIVVGDALGQSLDLVQRIVISPCSVSVLAYSTGAPMVLGVNSTGDLATLGLTTPASSGRARAEAAETAGRSSGQKAAR